MELTLATDAIPKFHIIVDFGDGIPQDAQGVVLLEMEKSLRVAGIPAEVFKKSIPDDSVLRRNMTQEQRLRL